MSRGNSGSTSAILSIRTRIILLVGGVLFLFSVITGYCIYTLLFPPPAGIHSGDASGKTAAIGKKIEDMAAEAKHNADQFISRQNAESVVQFKSAMARLIELGRQLEERAGTGNDAAAARQAARIISLAEQYDSAFQKLVHSWEAKGLHDSEGLRDQLRSAAVQLTDLSSGEESTGAEKALARIPAAQDEYFAANGSQALRSLETAVHDLGRIVGESDLAVQQKQQLQKNIREYTTALSRHQAVSLPASDTTLSAALAKEQQRQAGAVHDAWQRLEKAMYELYASQTALQIEAIRRHEEKYLLQGEEKEAGLVLTSLDQLAQSLTGSSFPEERKAAMLHAIRHYRDAFHALERQNATINNHVAEVNQAFSKLEHDLGPAINKPGFQAKVASYFPPLPFPLNVYLIAGLSIAVILLSLLAALRLGESITSPILRLSESVRRMYSEDDAAVDFSTDRKDELGMLARELSNLVQARAGSTGLSVHASLTPADNAEPAPDVEEGSGNDVKVARLISAQSPLLERIGTIVDRMAVLCDSTVQDVDGIIERVDEFHTPAWAADVSPVNTPEADESPAGIRRQITEIIRDTSDLAEETVVLALNASIKAARAGTRGNEFTIVAEELDKLAKRAKETAGKISASLHTLAPRLATGSGPEPDTNPAVTGDIPIDSGSLQKVKQGIQTIADQVDGLKNALAELSDTHTMIESVAGDQEGHKTETEIQPLR